MYSLFTFSHVKRARPALGMLILVVLALTGCDASVDSHEPAVTYRGRVTDDGPATAGALRLQHAADVVAEADVKAYVITDNGTRVETGATATTDAEGTYTLLLDQEAAFVVLEATKGSFSSQVVAFHRPEDGTVVDVAPMTAETRAEAEVYLEARRDEVDNDGAEGAVTLADVALYVDATVAADMTATTTTAAEVAAALRSEAEAEEEYVDEAENADDRDADRPSRDRREAAREAYAVLQARLAAATTASAETDARLQFEETMLTLYDDAETRLAIQAQARQAGRIALEKAASDLSAETRFALEHQAAVQAAVTSALAIEEAFEASGTGAARLSTLADARTTLLADLRAATSASALAEARATYEATVEAELAAKLDVSGTVLSTARSATSAAKTSLQAALSTAVTAEAIAAAHLAYFASAESTIEASLATSGNAALGADVLVLFTLQ